MAMSRTARILVAILLLAAAAFFWVNFYTQNRTAETPVGNGVADSGATPADTGDGAADTATPEAAAGNAAAADGGAAAADTADAGPAGSEADAGAPAPVDTAATPEATPVAEGQPDAGAAEAASTETPDVTPPTVVVDAPVAVGREIVISDLPFLVTEPRPTEVEAVADATAAGGETPNRQVTAARVTVNPFSPVVVQAPPAPAREVPTVAATPTPAAAATPAVATVAVPAAPVRAEAPTPRAVAPIGTAVSPTLRPLPSGAVLSSTPDLLRQPRVAPAASTLDLVSVAAIVVPEAEAAQLAEPDFEEPAPAATAETPGVRPVVEAPPADVASDAGVPTDAAATPEGDDAAQVPTDAGDVPAATPADGAVATPPVPEPVVPDQADAAANPTPPTPNPNTPAPLPAGVNSLSRYLRDNNYTFTGSVVGPVGVGVFRSNVDPAAVVVALGQTLPGTDIVLTDLRGQQAELTLGDDTQILTLDLRR